MIIKRLYFSLREKTFQNRLKYILQKNGSSTLIISFSGFPGNIAPSYNYIRTLSGIKYDKLFILDDFGFRGSYYWFENGKDSPRRLTQGLINQVILGGV